MAVAVVRITIVLDMMCPWSFIGLRSLELAMRQAPSGVAFEPTILPFEFDPPGTYPAEGQPWTEYCEGYGAEKAAFLLGQKLPRAFALGERVGIEFSLERRIVGTETVNAALTAVQRHGGSAVAFALTLLSHHFERLRDPNDPELLRPLLRAHGVPEAEWPAILEPSPQRAAANAAVTQQGRAISGGSVPRFVVRCGDSDDEIPGPADGPTSPDYFSQLIAECLARRGSGSGSASDKTCLKSDDAETMRGPATPWPLFGNRTGKIVILSRFACLSVSLTPKVSLFQRPAIAPASSPPRPPSTGPRAESSATSRTLPSSPSSRIRPTRSTTARRSWWRRAARTSG